MIEHTWECAFVTRGGVCDCGAIVEWPEEGKGEG